MGIFEHLFGGKKDQPNQAIKTPVEENVGYGSSHCPKCGISKSPSVACQKCFPGYSRKNGEKFAETSETTHYVPLSESQWEEIRQINKRNYEKEQRAKDKRNSITRKIITKVKTTLPASEPSSKTKQSAKINQVTTEQVQIADCMIKILNYYKVGMEKMHLDMMLNTLSSVEYFTHLGYNPKQHRNEYVSAFNYFLTGLSKPLPSPRLISLTQINREYYEQHIVEWKMLASLFNNLKMKNANLSDIAKICMNVYDNGFIESWKNDWETFTFGLKRLEYPNWGELGNQQSPSNPIDSSTSLSRAEVAQHEMEQMKKERLGK